MTLKVSEETARWLLHVAERDPALGFNSFFPFYCRLCDSAVPPAVQAGHLGVHRRELNGIQLSKRQQARERLNEALALKREAAQA